MKLKLLITFISLLLLPRLYAGKYAAEFLTTGVGARALSMGGAFVAVSNDASAAYWNPAGLRQLTSPEIHFMHASRFSDMVQTDFINVVYPGQKVALGLSYLRLGIDNIPYTNRLDINGRPLVEKYMSDSEQAAFLSFGLRLNPKLSLGGNVKALWQKIGENSSLGFGLDLGVHYQFNSAFSFGAIAQDISGTHLYWENGHRDTKMPDLKYGFAYRKSFLFLRSGLLLSVQQNVRFEGRNYSSQLDIGEFANSDFQFGGEYRLMDIVALRLGSSGGDLTAGTGISFKMLQIDYAFMSYDLGNAHRVSASVRF